MTAFKGLSSDTFAAYTPEKWASNVHNLARMRAKDTLLALCDQAQRDLQTELVGLDRASSDEVPNIINHKKVDAQWVYWFRDAAARKNLASFLEKTPLDEQKLFNIAPQDKHLAVAVVLRQTDLWLGLWLAAGAVVDRRNFSASMQKAWEREQLRDLILELPEGASFGAPTKLAAAGEITLAGLADLTGTLGSDQPAWQIGHSIPATDAIELGVELADHVGRWLGALLPIYRFLAWEKANDHIDVNRQLQEEKAQKRRQALGFGPGDKVRIISGMFSGKLGVVQDIDAKAQVRVLVGKLSVVVSGTDLTSAA
ncbi:MAG: KOW motif-containing protein [Deltaproteobacteria bacterium]|nr:KOW motif-containing protein [Deltaproteobacteria bacterium]